MTSQQHKQAWLLCFLATLTMTVSYVDRQSFAVLSPMFSQELGINDAQFGLLASAFSFAYLLATPFAGRWIDLMGARRGLMIAVAVWSVVAMLHAGIAGFMSLFLLRILLGITEAPSFPGAAQTIHRVLPVTERARAFGLLFTGSSLGAMLAAPIASYLASHWGYRFGFFGTACIGLIWIPFWWYASRPAAIQAKLNQLPVTPSLPQQDRVPSKRWALLREPALWRGATAVAASAPIAAFVFLWAPKFLTREFNLGQQELGFYLMVPPVLFDLGSLLFGDWGTRIWRRQHNAQVYQPFSCCILLLLSLALIPIAGAPWQAVVLMGLAMAGSGGMFALLTAEMLNRLPAASVGEASGLVAASQSLLYILTNLSLGWALQKQGSYELPIYALASLVIPFSLYWLMSGLRGEAMASATKTIALQEPS